MNVILEDKITSTEELRGFETEIAFLKEKTDMQSNHIKSLEKLQRKQSPERR